MQDRLPMDGRRLRRLLLVQIRCSEANGTAGVAACARAIRSKSGKPFADPWSRSSTIGLRTIWIASLNVTALGVYLERGEAMRRVEEQIEYNMSLVLHDWDLYQAAKAKLAE
jgi:hypothetical protein